MTMMMFVIGAEIRAIIKASYFARSAPNFLVVQVSWFSHEVSQSRFLGRPSKLLGILSELDTLSELLGINASC